MGDEQWPAFTANALTVLARRYLQPRGGRSANEAGHGQRDDGTVAEAGDRALETPEDMLHRVAGAIAAVESRYGATAAQVAELASRFFARMRSLEFLPNSPTLMNAGTPDGQLAACFVVPVKDSTRDIFQAIGWAAEIQKTGGGTGFSFSQLRPAGAAVRSTGGVASGPVGFLQVFDAATEAIKQGGTRRGANMGMLRVDHPDILDFIAVKLSPDKMTNFNLSVAVTDAFMEAVIGDKDYALSFALPNGGEISRRISAARVFEAMVNAAWAVGDPGLVFIDRVNADNPTPELGAIEATNPCGEQPLLPFESCTLGSLNLVRFVRDDGARGAVLDWERLGAAVEDAVRFLDNVVDANAYPLAQIRDATLATRKIGLGVMGFADALVELGIAYDAPAALELAADLGEFIERRSVAASQALAAARGTYPAAGPTETKRNATTTTVAPTGTISIIAGCSSGIEPLYALAYDRHVLDGEVLPEISAAFRARAVAAGVMSEELANALRTHGRARGLLGVPPALATLFPTAHDLPPEVHVRMQAVWQRYAHAAVSKTVNLPNAATPTDVRNVYLLAYELGCKGVTVYRDGSRATQVLASGGQSSTSPVPPPAAAGATTVAGATTGTDSDCPECRAQLRRYGRCRLCPHCGWSACA